MKKPEKEDWMQKKWRPMMAVMYMCVCVFDFVLFPIMFTIVQFWEVQAANDAFRQWNPITLLGGGLFHVAMGAVLGVSAWSRGQEKIAGVATNMQPAAPIPAPVSTGRNIVSTGWQAPPVPYEPEPTVTYGYKGKKAPPEPEYPTI